VSRASGIAAGFEHFRQPEGHSRIGGETMKEVLAWLETLGESETFFLWVHLWDPHKPYRAPEGHRGIFDRDEALDGMLASRGIDLETLEEGGSWERLPRLINRYDEEILYADAQVGRLLTALKDHGRYRDTLIVLAGDHGEGLGQHGERGHGCVHEEQLRVPLLVRVPGRAPERLDTPISLTDLLPTLLGLLPALELGELVAQASGRDRLGPGGEEPSLMGQRTPRDGPGLHPYSYVLIRRDWKLYHEPGGAEHLYDLRADPLETTDVAAEHPEILEEMREELTGRLRHQVARGGELRGDAPEERLADPELVEQLRALGYLD
jgi:arylsulfatase A-like enzyme